MGCQCATTAVSITLLSYYHAMRYQSNTSRNVTLTVTAPLPGALGRAPRGGRCFSSGRQTCRFSGSSRVTAPRTGIRVRRLVRACTQPRDLCRSVPAISRWSWRTRRTRACVWSMKSMRLLVQFRLKDDFRFSENARGSRAPTPLLGHFFTHLVRIMNSLSDTILSIIIFIHSTNQNHTLNLQLSQLGIGWVEKVEG